MSILPPPWIVIGASWCFGSFVGLKPPSAMMMMLPARIVSPSAVPAPSSATSTAVPISIFVFLFIPLSSTPPTDGRTGVGSLDHDATEKRIPRSLKRSMQSVPSAAAGVRQPPRSGVDPFSDSSRPASPSILEVDR